MLSVHGSLCIETLNSACSLSAFASTNQFELRTALELKKKILLVHEDDRRRHGCFDFGEKTKAPADIAGVLDQVGSVALIWRIIST